MKILQKISLWVQALFYIGGGINHFIAVGFYTSSIPAYIPFKPEVNIAAGIVEILLGTGLLLFIKHRKKVVILIILFLLALLPAHIYHLMRGGCLEGGFCIPIWACWIRIFLQFLLMYWAWSVRKIK
jgi:uncharacterized membrane protein